MTKYTEYKAMLNDGLTAADIAKKYKVSRQSVYYIIKIEEDTDFRDKHNNKMRLRIIDSYKRKKGYA